MAVSQLLYPPFIPSSALSFLLKTYFPFKTVDESSIKQLDGYDDKNYQFNGRLVDTIKGSATRRNIVHQADTIDISYDGGNQPRNVNQFVVKFLNSRDSKIPEVVDGLVELTKFLYNRGFNCPYAIPSKAGYEVVSLTRSHLLTYSTSLSTHQPDDEGTIHNPVLSSSAMDSTHHYPVTDSNPLYCITVSVFIEGEVLGYGTHPPKLLHELGAYFGRLDKELMNFSHEGLAKRVFKEWDLKILLSRREDILSAVQKKIEKERVLNAIFNYFEKNIIPVMDKIERGFIHGDFNLHNIIVDSAANPTTINGVIDLSNSVLAPLVFDLGISLAYIMARKEDDPINYVKPIIQGYLSVYPLSKESMDILYYVILARAAQSVINAAIFHQLDPSNEYILIDDEYMWRLIYLLLKEGKQKCDDAWGI